MSTHIFDNEDSDDDEPIFAAKARIVAKYTVKQDSNESETTYDPNVKNTTKQNTAFKPRSKAAPVAKEFVVIEEDFPDLGMSSSGKNSSPSIGVWENQSKAHEYTETNVVPTIKMPPIFSSKRKEKDEVMTCAEMKEYLDDEESDVEFIDEETMDDHEVNPNIGQEFSKGGW